ncbi:MAG: hypothetical protein F9K22_02675 [Bacteroidetes bacterium]|nr:MAG: hypothetical protein F9K22_02675 [Bacteroidota bacterium]
MKKTTIDTGRRRLFARFGLGALSAGILSALPFRSTAAKAKRTGDTTISVTIDPMAVKRTNKG